jgi:hypothetical protein
MGDPFALFHGLGSSTQSHKVTLDNMLHVVGVKP